MFKFKAEQKIFEVYGVKVGGEPGQLPTVMIGSIFYHGDKLVKDEKKGIFDKDKAEELLKKEEEIAHQTGNPRMIDIVAASTTAMEKYIEFIAGHTFLIDGTTEDVKIAGVKYVSEVGLSSRAIYNSISTTTKQEELIAIRDSKITSAILLAINTRKPTIDGRLEVLSGENGGLVEVANKYGIEKPLVDPGVLDLPDPGPAAKTIHIIKEQFGLPAGCAAHNAIDLWSKRKKLSYDIRLIGNVVANTVPTIMGADFVFYGPISRAEQIYPAIALADAYIAYCMQQQFKVKPLTKDHPLYKIFK